MNKWTKKKNKEMKVEMERFSGVMSWRHDVAPWRGVMAWRSYGLLVSKCWRLL